MRTGQPDLLPRCEPLSVALYAIPSGDQARQAIQKAEQALAGLGLDYEILVIATGETVEAAQAPTADAPHNARVRYIPINEPSAYSDGLSAGLRYSRFPLMLWAHGSQDLRDVGCLLPLIERHDIVSSVRRSGSGSCHSRSISWGYNGLARLLLGTGVREHDGSAVLSLFRRSSLPPVMPVSRGHFAYAELLARAIQQGLAIAEVTLVRTAAALPRPRSKTRDVFGALAALIGFWWSGLLFAGRPCEGATRTRVGPLVLATLAALLLFSDLNQPLLDPDEGRQAEVPREMLAHGDLLRPRMLGLPYYEKPPLQYWLTAAAYTVLGVRPWVARLVPALAAWLVVQLTYTWGRRTVGSRPAFLGALGLCLTEGFVMAGRTVVLDSLLTACVAASWYAAHLAVAQPALRRPWWILSALACGLGMLAKGPVALALLVPPVLAYQVLVPSSAPLRWAAWGMYAGLALLVAAPWYAAMAVNEPGYLAHFLWKANIVRFVSPYDHEQPWWFYLPVLFSFTFPWSLLLPALAYFLLSRARGHARLRGPGLGFCTLAAAWCFCFFSLSGCKSPLYIVPALPPLALLFGTCLDVILFQPAGRADARLEYARRTLPRWATLLMLLLAAGGCLAGVLLDWQERILTTVQMLILLALAAAWWKLGKQAQPAFAWAACALATGVLIVIPARDLVEGYASRHSPASIARLVRHWPGDKGRPVVSYARQWPSASFYLRRDLIHFFDETYRQGLVDFLTKTPEALVLVESGPPLDELLSALPDTLETEVRLPKREGQAALLVVRQRPRTRATDEADTSTEIPDATLAP